MKTIVTDFLQHLAVGPEQRYRNLVIFALLADEETPVSYLTLDEALEQRLLIITETDAAGEVPALKVVNNSSQKVLLLDGEELVGAKQNRILNITILLPPQSETVLPVSCIERGRWSYESHEFRSPKRTINAELRKKKTQSVTFAVRHFGAFHANQGEIWDEIEAKFARAQINPSPTQALSDLYEVQRESSEDYLGHFSPVAQQVGLAAAIDGTLAGVELLGRADSLQRLYPKLVGSYVLDALETAKQQITASPSPEDVQHLLDDGAAAIVERRPSVGLGFDLRLESAKVIGAGLEYEDHILHLSLFPQDSPAGAKKSPNPLRRASRRRRSIL
ncbi:MAG: ARPP-1 family domain-containing protein [Desulfobacca sp.]|uniref:ARPP-1 family domain-containing protein n=1 Tax=Desulfobacca sp. TaxID=2067990 RepID=UPI00404AB697